jgi:hypothetical protein
MTDLAIVTGYFVLGALGLCALWALVCCLSGGYAFDSQKTGIRYQLRDLQDRVEKLEPKQKGKKKA